MKLFLYYDEDLVYSMIAQIIGNDVDLDFVAFVSEKREEEGLRVAIEPGKRKENCNFNAHYSNSYSNENRKQYIFTNVEEIKQIRKNEFIYKMLNIIENYIIKIRNENRCFNFFHTKLKNKKNKNIKYLFKEENFSIKDSEINAKIENKVVFGIKITDELIKPICSYIKI